MTSPRHDLATRLDAAAPANVSVWAEEPIRAPALPSLVIRPGSPYREHRDSGPCDEAWRLEVVALVAIDTVAPLDALDPLIDLVRNVIAQMPWATYRGVRSAPTTHAMGGKDMRGATVEVDIWIEET